MAYLCSCQKSYAEALSTAPPPHTLFGDRVSKEVIKLKQNC
jgi:hypothetical protein